MGVGGHHHAPFKKTGFRWMGGWLCPKIGLDVVKDKMSLSRFEARTVYPVAYSLHYGTQTTKLSSRGRSCLVWCGGFWH